MPLIEPVKHPATEAIARLTGSSSPTGAPPSFEPIATTAEPVAGTIRTLSEADPVFEVVRRHKAAYAAWRATGDGGVDLQSEGPLVEEERAALDAVEEATPQTVAGLKSWISYLALNVERDGCWAVAERVLPRISDAVQDLVHAAPLSPTGTGYDAELLALGAELDRILALIPADQTLWSMTWLIAALGRDRPVSAIADRDVAELVARRRGEVVDNKAAEKGRARARAKGKPAAAPRLVRPSTVNRSVTEPLRKVLHRARDVWDQDVQRIDCRHMLKEPQERVRELKVEEEQRLFVALPAQFHPAVRFTLRTGCRLSETALLPWSAVDWGARSITIDGKGAKKAAIPMTARVRELLWPLQGNHDSRVFTYADGKPLTVHGLDAAWGRALAKAGIEDFRFHDLRHTTATRLLRRSGNLKMVQRLLRHEDITTTARYAHVLDEDLWAAMEDVEQAETPKVPTEIPTTALVGEKREA